MNEHLQARLRAAFGRLNRKPALRHFPSRGMLAGNLEELMPEGSDAQRNVESRVAELFASASIDMWLRSVHSFLTSASLTHASPIWAVVSGYYASHYSIRAIAHLLGYFLLFGKRRIVQWDWTNGRHICSFRARSAGEREHKLYWNWVKQDEHFESDPIFTSYNPGQDISDVRHRDTANYADHLYPYPDFRSLNKENMKERIRLISKIEFMDPPIPDIDRFIDIDSVQIIAYHRIVRFRQFLDEALGAKNRFWNMHRSPTFSESLIDFQLVELRRLSGLSQ